MLLQFGRVIGDGPREWRESFVGRGTATDLDARSSTLPPEYSPEAIGVQCNLTDTPLT